MSNNVQELRNSDFWRKAWDESRKSSLYHRKKIRTEAEVIEFWNRFAPSYGTGMMGSRQQTLEDVVRTLEQKGVLGPESPVLDVGCGPGNYALPFARRVKTVTALDGAVEMCNVLKEKKKEAGLNNITVLHRMWEDVDLEQEGLFKGFDLAFASMTPGVCDYETLMKLNQSSRGYCCIIAWAGGHFGGARQELQEIIFQEKETEHGYNIIYPFNILYHEGYYPELRYLDFDWEQKQTQEEAVEGLCRSFWLYLEVTTDIREIIKDYVSRNSQNGVFHQVHSYRLGMMTWSANNE